MARMRDAFRCEARRTRLGLAQFENLCAFFQAGEDFGPRALEPGQKHAVDRIADPDPKNARVGCCSRESAKIFVFRHHDRPLCARIGPDVPSSASRSPISRTATASWPLSRNHAASAGGSWASTTNFMQRGLFGGHDDRMSHEARGIGETCADVVRF